MEITIIPKAEQRQYESILPFDIYKQETVLIAALEKNSAEGILAGTLHQDKKGKEICRIEDLFVTSDSRRQGVAGEMLCLLESELTQRGIGRLRARLYDEAEDPAVCHWLLTHGFFECKKRAVYETTLQTVRKGILQHPAPFQRRAGMPLAQAKEPLSLPFYRRTDFDPNLSRVCYNTKGEMTGMLLVRRYEDALSVDYLWCAGHAGRILTGMIAGAVSDAGEMLSLKTRITFHAENPKIAVIVQKMTGEMPQKTGEVTDYEKEIPL